MVAACAASCTTVSSDRPVFSLMRTRLPSLDVLPGASGLSCAVTSTSLTLTPLTSTTAANLPAMRRATWLLLFSEMLVSTAASLLLPSKSILFADRGVSFGPEVPRSIWALLFASALNSIVPVSPSKGAGVVFVSAISGARRLASSLAADNSAVIRVSSSSNPVATVCFRRLGSTFLYPAICSLTVACLALKSSTFF